MKISTLWLGSALCYGFYTTMMASCNGHTQLSSRRYNQVAYAATHNGQSHKESDVHNQDLPIKEQFERGIRATKVHIWYDQDSNGNAIPFVCHGIDKKYLYEMPTEKVIEQVPLIYKPFARAFLAKLEPMKGVVHRAFETAYGRDNAQGLIPFNHCILDPARRPLTTMLTEIRSFLDTHPREVITLILEDHTNNLPRIAQDFSDVGLLKYVHTQKLDEPWPFLKDMIKDNKRLVILFHGSKDLDFASFPWLHYIWDYAWDTKWEFKSVNDFRDETKDVIPNRGNQAYAARLAHPQNKLFIVYHFVTEMIGGSKVQAKRVNKKTVLRPRIERLANQGRQIPNIIQVDFFELPNDDIFDVVNELNGVGCYAGKPMVTF